MRTFRGIVGRVALTADRVLFGLMRGLLPRRAARLVTARVLAPMLVALDRLVMK